MNTKLTKSQIFTYAWELARTYAQIEGTGSRAQFSRALKEIHASAKAAAARAEHEAKIHSQEVEEEYEAERQERAAYLRHYGLVARA